MSNKVDMLRFTLVVVILIIAIPLQAQANVFYVDQSHPVANDMNPGTIDLPWKTINKANQTLVAGDTVHIKAGTYTNYINPVNSGASDSARITYNNYGSDVVLIKGLLYGIHLNGDHYITVQGINFLNNNQHMILENNADYNIIDGCSFDGDDGTEPWAGSRIWGNSDHNIIRNNTFSNYGHNSGVQPSGTDYGAALDIGNENTTTDNSDYNLIEGNTLFHAGHHVVGINSRYNTVRNNYIYNDVWDNGYGNRTLYLNGWAASSGWNLIENNRMGYAAEPVDAYGVSGALVGTHHNIIRYNSFYHNNLSGLELACYDSDASYNTIYNNTFFNNAYNPDRVHYGARYFGAITLSDWNAGVVTERNIIKNNLYYSHSYDNGQPIGVNGTSLSAQTIANNFDGDSQGNPLFVNASTIPPADKTDPSVPNLNLLPASPAKDIGGALTTVAVTDTSSGTSLVVSDATYFQDGTFAPAGAVQTDWIAVGTVGNTVQISAINYSTNTITLANSISRQHNDSVWLFKKSDGQTVLYGTTTDAGAYEYGGFDSLAPAAPQYLMAN